MKARALLALTIFCLMAVPSLALGSHRVWQTGKLVNVEPGLAAGGRAVIAFTAAQPRLRLYMVETDAMIYEFSAYAGQGARDSHPLSVDRQVKFWLDSNKPGRALLVDDNGKAFKASVVKTVPRRAAPGN
jgi:hypothetical protein